MAADCKKSSPNLSFPGICLCVYNDNTSGKDWPVQTFQPNQPKQNTIVNICFKFKVLLYKLSKKNHLG